VSTRANFYPCQQGTVMDDRELTMDRLLADPMTRAMMAADRVDPAELRAAWTALAQKLSLARATERSLARACQAHLSRGYLSW
jgi:hypothetical protein